jgi:hypothetical protein
MTHIGGDGYVRIYGADNPGGSLLEHRLIMEEHLGKHLTKNEVVHHINGNRQDNRIENLQLLSRGEHCHLHLYGRKRSKADENTRCVDCGEITREMKPNPMGGRPYPYWFIADKAKQTWRCHRCYNKIWKLKRRERQV